MDIAKALQVYHTVVRRHSFVDGARELGISTTSASRTVQELEQELGARLINRTTRKLNVTEAGLLVYNHGREILDNLEDLRSSINTLSLSVEGSVRMTCPVSLGVRVIMPLMRHFLSEYPKMTVEVSLTNRFIDLVDEGFDVAVRLGQEMPSTTIVRSLGQSRTVVCASPAFLARAGTPDIPQDLANQDSVVYRSARQTFDTYEFLGDDGGPVIVCARGVLFVDSTDAMREAVLSGCGFGAFPAYTVAEDISSGRLVAVFQERSSAGTDVSIIYPHRTHLSRKVRTLVDFLAERIKLN